MASLLSNIIRSATNVGSYLGGGSSLPKSSSGKSASTLVSPSASGTRSSTAMSAVSPTVSPSIVSNERTISVPTGGSVNPYAFSQQSAKDRYVQSQVPSSSSGPSSLYANPGESYDQYQARVGSGASFSPTASAVPPSAPAPRKSSARTAYEQAAADYIDSLGESKRTSDARKAYQNLITSRDTGLQNIQDQAIPMQFITGQQASVARRAQIEADRLQGDIEIAQDEQQGNQAQALARYNLLKDDFSNESKAYEPINVGGVLYQLQDDGSYKALTPKEQEGYTLGEGDVRFGPDNTPVAYGPAKSASPGKIVNVNGKDYLQNADGSFSEPDVPGAGSLSPTSQSAISLIDQLLGRDTDDIAGIPDLRAFIPGTDAQLTANLAKQLSGLLSLDNIKLLKGTGAISDAEQRLLANAASALGIDSQTGRTKLSNDALKSELSKIRESLSSATGSIQTTPDGRRWKVMPDGSYQELSFSSGANRPQRNNNPGNVKEGGLDSVDSMAIGTDEQGHLIFPDAATGLRALSLDLDAKIGGNSRYVPANPTIAQIGRAYAEDGTWASKVARILGVSPNALASSVDRNRLIRAVATQEGFYA